MKNILFATSECVPFIKTGGLADVAGSLPGALPKNEFDVRVILPKYACMKAEYQDKLEYVHHFYMDMGNMPEHAYVGILTCELEGVRYYFIDNEHYFCGDKPYGDLKFDLEKFTFFSKAVLAAMPVIGFHPDVIHCHDWQTALVPVYLRTLYKYHEFYYQTQTVLTIHNLKFQGVENLGLFRWFAGMPEEVYTMDRLEFKKDVNVLKGGIVYCDRLTTVSRSYAGEIQGWSYGEGLDGVLRCYRDKLRGIVNGLDYKMYNPATDPMVVEHFTAKTMKAGKAANKRALQEELGLPQDPDAFMLAIVSRLTDQKGLDLVNCVMQQIVDPYTQFVILGTGDAQYENAFRHYEYAYRGKVSSSIYYNEERSRHIYASADAVLMPSRFEPCGLTQLIAMRYGTVPIVRETGGLRDTVEPFNEYENLGTGFSFQNYNAHEMLNLINYAKRIYFEQRAQWDQMALRCMEADFSWASSAAEYAALYRELHPWGNELGDPEEA